MALTPKETDQIAKLLEKTSSENDNEALAFMRKVQAILAKNKMTWEALIGSDIMFMSARQQARDAQTEVKRLSAEVRRLQDEIVALKNANLEVAERLEPERERVKAAEAQISALRREITALKPKPDPWEAPLAQFLKRDKQDRYLTHELLDVIGVKERPDAYRRLGRCMRAIGGWKPSNNVAEPHGHGVVRLRGYIRVD